MKRDIYQINKRVEGIVEQIENEDISKKNKEFILDFKRHCVLNNLGELCLLGYLRRLKQVALWLGKDFDKVNKKDIEALIQKLYERNYKPLTRTSFKIIIKKFYKWLKGNNISYPKEVEWIKTTLKRTEKHLPGEGDLINEQEIKKLIGVAEHPRDKAFISVLYESGCRIGEICSLCVKDIKFDKYGVLIHVYGKTGARRIRLISSVPFLSNWINSHPFRDNRDSILWICVGCKHHNRPLAYQGVHNLLKRLFEKAEIKKRFNPHLFRHSRATFLASYLTEFQMNQYFGWVQGSNMPATYVHLSGKNVDSAILELNGVKSNVKKVRESELKPKKCPRCDTVNSFNDKFCSKCACVLDVKTMMELESDLKQGEVRLEGERALDFLMRDREFREIFVKKIGELGLVR